MFRFIIIFLIAIVFSNCSSEEEKIKFNKAQWLQGDWRTRGKMVDNIIDDSLLIGKTKLQVLDLLGDPTASDTISSISYVVDIGMKGVPCGAGGVWPFYLNLAFDSTNNKVKSVNCRD